MPVRVRALPPGEFIRDHLVDVGGVDFVQSIYNAYKDYLKAQGLRDGISRATMSNYIYLANRLGLVVFDHAEASERWGSVIDGVTVPRGYVREARPQAPSPRHYYRIVDPADPRWVRLQASYRQSIGLPVPPMFPRVPIRPPAPPPSVEEVPPPKKPPVKKPPRKPRVVKPRPPTAAERVVPYEERISAVLSMLDVLEEAPSIEMVGDIQNQLLDLGEDVLGAHKKARGTLRTLLGTINSRLWRGMERIGLLRSSVLRVLTAKPAARARAATALRAAIRVMREDLRPGEEES